MATGSRSTSRRPLRSIARPTAPVGACAGAAFAVLALTGCLREEAPPATVVPPTLQVVVATVGPPPVPTPGKQQIYEVREGDTLSAIAARFGVTEEAILKQNADVEADTLFAGQELVIPPAQP